MVEKHIIENEPEKTETAPSVFKSPDVYDVYKFSLSDRFKKIAKKELREDKSLREHSLYRMREWIAKHPHIKRCRTDAVFLLRFLRTKKFSITLACDMLENYLSIRQIYPNWFTNYDILDPEIEAIIDSGYLVPLLERDGHGRQVLFSVAGALDLNRVTSSHLVRVHSLVCEVLADDEESQICGYTHLIDESQLSMKLIGLWSFTDTRNILMCIQNALPLRQKENHLIGLPSASAKFVEFCTSLLSDKLKKRIVIHRNIDDLHKKVDPKILPKEYGGSVPMAELIRHFKERAKHQRAKLLVHDDMYIDVASMKNTKSCRSDLDTSVIGSFRKLEVD